MKIQEYFNYYNEKDYNIIIDLTEDIDANEIAECFKSQYPKTRCVISSSRLINKYTSKNNKEKGQ